MDRSPSIGSTIRDLVSYSAIAIVASFLCGTIWYIRIKFRHLMAQHQILPHLRAMTPRSLQSNIMRLHRANSTRSSTRPGSGTTATPVREPITNNSPIPMGYHEHPAYLFKDDLPPSYTSLAFPLQEIKEIPTSQDNMEFPPPYRSIFTISPPTPVEIT